MQSTIDVSTAVCESAGIKRAASPRLSSSAENHQPLPQHEFPCPTDQVCYYKRLRTSDSSLKTQNTHATSARAPPSIVWRDFRNQEAKIAEEAQSPNYEALDPRDQMSNMIARTATPFTSTQHSKPGIEPRGPGEYFKPHGSLHNFFTKASIKTPRGVVDLERVQVDERSPFNLVPWSIATNLDLMLYSGKTLAITIAHHLIQTNHYSHFAIRVAGRNTTINTGVVSGLQTILLGREWIRSVHLLSDGNQKYYMPIPLAVELAEEKFPDIVDTEAEAKDVKPVDMATSDEIAEKHDDNESRKTDEGNGQSSRDDGSFSESEPSFDGQNLLDGGTPYDEPSSGDDTLSDGGTSSEGPISGKHEVTPIDEDDEDDSEDDGSDDGDVDGGADQDQDDQGHENDEDNDGEDNDGEDDGGEDDDGGDDDGEDDDGEDDDGEDDDGEDDDGEGCEECDGCDECDGFDECEGCEDCNEYNECEGCDECEGYEEYEEFGEGEEDPDDNLQDFMEQHTHLERFADAEQTKEAHRRQSESKGEIVSAATVFVPG
jgi:hypothetical protein